MNALHMKDWFMHLHLIRGSMSDEFKGVIHDHYFWEIIISTAVIMRMVMFFAYLIWTSPTTGPSQMPSYPSFPFSP